MQTQMIGEVLQSFNSARLPVKAAERISGEIPYLGASGIVDYVDGFTHDGSYLCVAEDGANLLTRSLPIAWLQEGKFWANNHLHVLGGVNRNRLKFFQYAIELANIASLVTGSAQPKLNQASLLRVEVPALGRTQENVIGYFLNSIDDKIASNQTAVSTGSDLLISLYREVQKHAAEPFGQVCDVFGGSTPSTKVDEYWGGSINWATPTDLTALRGPWLTDTERKITEAGLQSMSSTLHPPGSILMTSRATIGQVAVAATPATTNQGFIVIRAREELTPWIFCQLQDRVREFEAWSNGATFLELSRGNFKKLPFYRAEPQDLAEFNAKARPLLEMCKKNQAENIALANTRDELLPLLMSGRITVREAKQEALAAGVSIPGRESEK